MHEKFTSNKNTSKANIGFNVGLFDKEITSNIRLRKE